MRKLAGVVALLVSLAAPASGIRSANLGHGIRSGGMSRLVDMPTGGALFEFLPASGNGAPVAMDLCDAITSDDKAGNWWCLKGDGTYSSAAGLTTTLTGTSLVTRPRCSNGLNCNTQAGIYADSTDSIVTASETLGTTAVSLVVQHMPKDLVGGEVMLGFSAVAGSGYLVAYHSATTFVCQVANTSGASTSLSASGNSAPRAWQTFACTYEDNGSTATLKAYRDGVLVGTNASAARPLPTSVIISDYHAIVGAIQPGLYAGHFVTAKVLSDADLLRIHNASMGTLTGSRGETVTFSRSSAQTCDNGSGSVTVMPSGRPCVAQGGYLSEGSATNVQLRSEEFDSATWTKHLSSSVSANSALCGYAPDGTLTADLVTSDGASVGSGVFSAGRPPASGNFATDNPRYSFWGWIPSGDSSCTVAVGDANTGFHTRPTLTTTPVRQQWSGSTAGTSQAQMWVGYSDTGSPKCTRWCMWGAHVEGTAGKAFSSSYIRTEGSMVTRQATKLTGTKPTALGDTQGCMAGTVKVPAVTAGARVVDWNAGYSYLQSTTDGRSYDSTNTVTATAGSSVVDRYVRLATAWQGSTLTSKHDGVESSGSYDSALTGASFFIGSTTTPDNHLNGFIKQVEIDSSLTRCDQ